MSFLVDNDILTHSVVEQIVSLMVMLRLWRLVKIEELSLRASEKIQEIEAKVV